MPTYRVRALASILLVSAAAGAAARADDRRFGFVEMTDTLPKGGFETEQWFTWETLDRGDSDFNRFTFKHEFEYGITNELQLGVDVLEWHFQTGQNEQSPHYDSTSAELKYRFMDPHEHMGIADKIELSGGDQLVGAEEKLVIDKYLDKWLLAYNLVIEATWEGSGLREHNGEIEQSAGASYEVSTGVFLGLEFLHEIELPHWKYDESEFFLGPNFSFHRGAYEEGNWAITITPLFRLGNEAGDPGLQLRLLFEYDF